MSFMAGLFGGGMNYDPYQGKLGQSVEDQKRFVEALGAQTPQAIANQQMLAQQLVGQTQGLGPSVAQASLAQATGQNAAQIGALLGSQRGAGANVGLIGRQAGQLGSQAMQQAAGQAATLRAQEQLAAQQALANLAGTQLGQVQTGLSQQIGGATSLEDLKQKTEAQKAQRQGNILGQVLGAAGTILNPVGTVIGGALGKAATGLLSGSGGRGPMGSNAEDYKMLASGGYVDEFRRGMLGMAQGGQVPAMVSPGEKYLPPSEVQKVAMGQKPVSKAGQTIPGKAKVPGDSLKNDTVKKTLKEGGIVIPRTVMQSNNPEEQARKFVASVLAKQKMKRK
jgi:hypothetical protein